MKQHNGRTLKLAAQRALVALDGLLTKEAREPFAVATAQAQEEGYANFDEGSPGRARRDEIAESIKDDGE